MSASLFPFRRIERFAQLVEEAGDSSQPGSRRPRAHQVDTRPIDDEQLQAFAELTSRLSDLPLTVEAQPEFREGLRAMLMATIEREGIGATAKPEADPDEDDLLSTVARYEQQRIRRRARTLGALVAGLAAGALALSGISVASDGSLPGDRLYSIKRQTERAQMALTGSDTSRGQLYLEFAKTRLDEARGVEVKVSAFSGVLDDMDDETREGVRLLTGWAVDRHDASALDVIDAFVTTQRQGLRDLRDELSSAAARQRTDTSIQLVEQVSERSVLLRPLLPCGTSATGEPDELGPTPRLHCSAGQTGGQGQTGQGTGSQPSRSPAADPQTTKRPAASGTAQPNKPAGGVTATGSTTPSSPSAESGQDGAGKGGNGVAGNSGDIVNP